jgi:hypothetical protein
MTLPALRPQYPYAITDQGFNLRGRHFNVTVAWNVMPKVGALSKRVRTFAGASLLVSSKLALLICLAIRFVWVHNRTTPWGCRVQDASRL